MIGSRPDLLMEAQSQRPRRVNLLTDSQLLKGRTSFKKKGGVNLFCPFRNDATQISTVQVTRAPTTANHHEKVRVDNGCAVVVCGFVMCPSLKKL
jgi:hypothetical protein